MGLEQSAIGKCILILGSIGFIYYSVWVLSVVRSSFPGPFRPGPSQWPLAEKVACKSSSREGGCRQNEQRCRVLPVNFTLL